MSATLRAALMAALLPWLSLPAFAEGDPAKGEKSFKKCMACHTVAADGPSKAGPNLHDVVGRKTGTLEGFAYSTVMRTMGEEGHIWTPEELDLFLENPKKMAPGTKMTFAGLKKPEERADVVAYLISLHPEGVAAGEAAPGAAPDAEPDAASEATPAE
ncbi:cytochrome c family protein [Rhodobacter sp. 24-YEA-8]|uniref:c-type cytochrome n=1 Tax=Rhodobacter sp. 24-YEA-8 TaxID=1884310 RepID=UPI000897B6A0|nr:cytochrome c family protein [Rhodobacter sp. 24-YEA-8]SED58377.1 cytochrome c [Rhodobacter sp. 24-YEA-8]